MSLSVKKMQVTDPEDSSSDNWNVGTPAALGENQEDSAKELKLSPRLIQMTS